jgi:hypothetical protein
LNVREQNYAYDLLNPAKLLDKYVGREVMLVLPGFDASKTAMTPVKATLLSNNGGQVWRINDQVVINPYISETRFPDVPENLVATPTLMLNLENSNAGEQMVETSYLTGGLSWSTDYVLLLSENDNTADLQGWVTLGNNSGLSVQDAKLQLVAGNINRRSFPQDSDSRPSGTLSNPVPSFDQEKFFEYHLYTLQRPTSINQRETKQLSLLTAAGLTVHKEFEVSGSESYYRGGSRSPNFTTSEPVGVYLQFRNDSQNKLGMPLPAGTVRVYKKDKNAAQQFVGESRIDHTPKDENVRIKVGDAFDIKAERRQTAFKVVSINVWEFAYEIVIRNHNDVPVTVAVNEAIGDDWEMLSSTHQPKKINAFMARFDVPVEKDGTATLAYRVRVRR